MDPRGVRAPQRHPIIAYEFEGKEYHRPPAVGASLSVGLIDEILHAAVRIGDKTAAGHDGAGRGGCQLFSLREGPGEGPSGTSCRVEFSQTQELLTRPVPRPPAVILESMS